MATVQTKGYVAPAIGAAIVGVGAIVMALPTTFVVVGAIAGGFIGRWVASVATQTQQEA